MRAGMSSWSLPTSISSTVPLKMSCRMSARVARGVPAWEEVRGTTGSPSLTGSSSTMPAMGARMMDSTAGRFSLFTRPFSMRASFSWARLRRICASWMSRSARSASWVAMMPWDFRELARSAFRFACSKLFFAISTSRRASVSSRGVRVGQDLEERLARLHAVAHLAEAAAHDARDLALHRDLVFRANGAHREGLLDDGAASDGHGLEAVVLVRRWTCCRERRPHPPRGRRLPLRSGPCAW